MVLTHSYVDKSTTKSIQLKAFDKIGEPCSHFAHTILTPQAGKTMKAKISESMSVITGRAVTAIKNYSNGVHVAQRKAETLKQYADEAATAMTDRGDVTVSKFFDGSLPSPDKYSILNICFDTLTEIHVVYTYSVRKMNALK